MNPEETFDEKVTPYTDTRPMNSSVAEDTCNIIVVNLVDSVTEKDIRDLFGLVGEIASCKLVKNRETNQNQGYGFVLFNNPQSAEQAVLKFNGYHLAGKFLKVDFASKKKKAAPGGNDKNLYVAGLPPDTDEEKLQKLFERFGNINNVALLKSSSDSGRRVGFVMFTDVKDAETAIENMNGKPLHGSSITLTVKFAITKEHKGDNRRRAAPLKNFNSPGRVDISSKFLAGGVLGNSILSDSFGLSGLNPVNLSSLANPLMNLNPALNVLSNLNANNNPLNALAAIQQNAFATGANLLSNPLEHLLTPLLASQAAVPGGGPAVVNGVTVLPASGHNSLITGEVTTVFVQGLPPDCDALMLYELFSPFGSVLNVKPVVDKWDTKYCKGFAFVNFRKQEAAQHAIIAMNGYTFKGTSLQVSLKPEGLDYAAATESQVPQSSFVVGQQNMASQRTYGKYGF